MSLLEENFAVAAVLDSHAAAKIQSMLRMLENYETRIILQDPTAGGQTVQFELQPGGSLDELDTCCRVKRVERREGTLEA